MASPHDESKRKTNRRDDMWQTDFTYFKNIGWGWVYLSTVDMPILAGYIMDSN